MDEILLQILTELKELKQGQTEMRADISEIKEDIAIIKEDVEITREASNLLLDWATVIDHVTLEAVRNQRAAKIE